MQGVSGPGTVVTRHTCVLVEEHLHDEPRRTALDHFGYGNVLDSLHGHDLAL